MYCECETERLLSLGLLFAKIGKIIRIANDQVRVLPLVMTSSTFTPASSSELDSVTLSRIVRVPFG